MSFLGNIDAAGSLRLIFVQKEAPALLFSWQLSEIFNNNFFKEHCYKEQSIATTNVDHMSIANLIMQLLIHQEFYISVQFLATTRLVLSVKKIH